MGVIHITKLNMIRVYNRTQETYNENSFYIGRGSILGNPYSHLPEDQTSAFFKVSTRDEAIKNYSKYFDIKYGGDIIFKQVIDSLYNKYKKGEDVYLECYCKPKPCHGDVIIDKFRCKLMKEKIKSIKENK